MATKYRNESFPIFDGKNNHRSICAGCCFAERGGGNNLLHKAAGGMEASTKGYYNIKDGSLERKVKIKNDLLLGNILPDEVFLLLVGSRCYTISAMVIKFKLWSLLLRHHVDR